MDSLITPNTTSQNNNHFINSNNSNNLYHNQEKQLNPKKQIQYFSHLLEAFITFISQFNTTTPAYNLLLALLAYAGNRTTFFTNHENLYPLIHNYQNPQSVKQINKDSARKYVWRHITATELWMDQIGITLFTRVLPEKPKTNEKNKSTEYNILPLINILVDIIQEAENTINLFKGNIGQAIQASAIKKANELKESATPKLLTQSKNNQKQLTSEEQLDRAISLAESSLLKFKAVELAKHTSKEEIAKTLESKCVSLFNLFYNTIVSLREPIDPNLDSSQIDEICPTYQSHIYNYYYSVAEMSHTPSRGESDEEFLFKDGILHGDLDQMEVNESEGYGTNMSPTPLGQEQEQVLVNEQVAETFTVTLFDSQYEKVGTEADLTLREFVEHIGINNPVVITPKSDSDRDVLIAKQKNKGFCPVTFVSETEGRLDSSVESLSMVCFDYDDADFRVDLNPIISLGFRSFLYTSYSHTDINHRFRLGFVLKEPIPAKYYNLLWQKLFDLLKREVGKEGTKTILNIDAKCFNTGRMWYLPAIKGKDAPYYSEVFDSEDYQLLDWRVFIEQEIIDFDASIENLFQIPTPNDSFTVVEPQTVEEKNKKNVTLSFSQPIKYVDGADKPSISGYRWPSYLRALREKGGDKSLADSSWCYWCAVFGVPEAVAAVGLLQVSEKASYKASRPYGKGRYYHLDTAREGYDFYKRKHKK